MNSTQGNNVWIELGNRLPSSVEGTYFGFATSGTKIVTIPLCPDLLVYSDMGAADNLHGRVIRGFFWLLHVLRWEK
jgi:hypothetical protein